MKRRRLLITGVLLLLGGAIVNVAVAWSCAAWLFKGEPINNRSLSHDRAPSWLVVLESRPGHRTINLASLGTDVFFQMFSTLVDLAPNEILALIPPERRQVPEGCYQQCNFRRDWSGWPLYSMVCDTEGTWDATNRVIVQTVISNGIELPPVEPNRTTGIRNRSLPLKILWPGFAINTIFYAAILWLLFFAPGMVRRTIRRRRGLCPACAYPIGTSPVCTECGKAVSRRVTVPTIPSPSSEGEG